MRLQPIYDIAALCAEKGVNHAVLCPGSRCAPLTLAFTRHPGIHCRTFSDERSAGYIALGIAQHAKKPAALVVTSGTAVYNLAPAVAEAFFSEIPLLIFSADRPTEWIGQHDGQTIFQDQIFGKHVKGSYQLPQDYVHPDSPWEINRIVNEAINLARQYPAGPVHINVPLREPLYPEPGEQTRFSEKIRIIQDHSGDVGMSVQQQETIRNSWQEDQKILVVAGQQYEHEPLLSSLRSMLKSHRIPVVHDVLSNLHALTEAHSHADLFLGQASDDLKKSLRPDLLITFGQSLISKNLKLLLRKHKPGRHWHVQPAGIPADTFQHVTDIFRTTPSYFFDFLATLPLREGFIHQKQHNYHNLWEVEERRSRRVLQGFFSRTEPTELELVKRVIEELPDGASLHLANSMSVRYANFVGIPPGKNIRVFSNRGTSGIDGCTSTAVGHCLASGKPTFLITGDQAFFYDRNAFWHNYPLENLRILVLNNHGGLIFHVLDGPSSQPEAREYFVTDQRLTAKNLSEEFGFGYQVIDNKRKMANLVRDFVSTDGGTRILEMETRLEANKTVLEDLKLQIKKSYEL